MSEIDENSEIIKEKITNLLKEKYSKICKPFVLERYLRNIQKCIKMEDEKVYKRNNSIILDYIISNKLPYYENIDEAFIKSKVTKYSRIINIPGIAAVVLNVKDDSKENENEYDDDSDVNDKDEFNNNITKENKGVITEKKFESLLRTIARNIKNENVFVLIKTTDIQRLSFRFIDATYKDLTWIETQIVNTMNVKRDDILFAFEISNISSSYRKNSNEDIVEKINVKTPNNYNVVIRSIEGTYRENITKIKSLKIKLNEEMNDTSDDENNEKSCKIKVHDVITVKNSRYNSLPVFNMHISRNHKSLIEKKVVFTLDEMDWDKILKYPYFCDSNENSKNSYDAKTWIDKNPPKQLENKDAYMKRLNDFLGIYSVDRGKMKKLMEDKEYVGKRCQKDKKDYECWIKNTKKR
jgi:hypothetical protein